MPTSTEAPEIETANPARALQLGVGMASPLWPAFLATAGAGVAYWWVARWMNVEERSFAPADAAFPLGPPADLTDAVAQAYAEPVEAAAEAMEAASEQAAQLTEDLAVQGAAATEEVLDTAGDMTQAAADQALSTADTLADAGEEMAEEASDAASEIAAAAPKPPRTRRERPAE